MTETIHRLTLDSKVWDMKCINYLRKTTRQCQFDFDKVLVHMKTYFRDNQGENVEVNVDICRRVFAGDYYSESIPTISRPPESSSIPTIHDKNLSYSQIIDIIHASEDENARKQEKVFNRVLTSLKNDEDYNQTSSITQIAVENDSKQLFAKVEEQKQEREARRKKLQQSRIQQEEKQELERQREALRKRYEEKCNSDDMDDFCHQDINSLPSPKENKFDSGQSFDHPEIHFPVDNINMKDVFESKEFDMILDELEADLAINMAPSKNGDGIQISSELQEMFQMMDDASKIQIPRYVIENIDSSSYPMNLHSTRTLSSIQTSASTVSTTALNQNQWKDAAKIALTQSKHASENITENTIKSKINVSKPMTVNLGVKKSRYTDFTSRKNQSPKNKSKIEDEDEEDDEEDDDDDETNWRSMRSSLKKANSTIPSDH